MKKLTTLLLTALLLFGAVGTAMAFTPVGITSEVNLMEASGKVSNNLITQAFIDLSQIENKGTVNATVYESDYETQTVNTYNNLTIQSPSSCANKITRFVFELTNRYRPQNTDLGLRVSADRLTVQTYVYGQYKDQAMYAFLTGIPDCLNNAPYSPPSGGRGSTGSSTPTSSWVDSYSPDAIGTNPIASFQVTSFTVDKATYSTMTDTVAPELKAMDVTPYIKDSRTYVPVRYLAYALGVAENDVTWDGSANKVGIIKGDTNITLNIGNTTMTVNQELTQMDVAPEITNSRTMLPAQWVAEALGATVEWDATTNQATIKMPI